MQNNKIKKLPPELLLEITLIIPLHLLPTTPISLAIDPFIIIRLKKAVEIFGQFKAKFLNFLKGNFLIRHLFFKVIIIIKFQPVIGDFKHQWTYPKDTDFVWFGWLNKRAMGSDLGKDRKLVPRFSMGRDEGGHFQFIIVSF